MTIAVTTASGRLGREIIPALTQLALDVPVIGLARTPEKAADLGVEVRPGDYDKPEQLRASLTGVDTLLLVAGNAPGPERIQQHRNVITAAKEAGVTKIVFTSIEGAGDDNAVFEAAHLSRQTELDLMASGLTWIVGRNGLYIDSDVQAIDKYRASGVVSNSAGDGKCAYTTRRELAYAYARLLTETTNDGAILGLHGEPLSQVDLVGHLNATFGTQLSYEAVSVEAFRADCQAAMGQAYGSLMAGIYEDIRQGVWDKPSDFAQAAGRPHVSWDDYFASLKAQG